MALALGWADYLRSHATRLYSSGNTIVVEDGARLILERRATLPNEFTIRDIHQKGWAGLTDRDVVMSAVDLLEETHHCRKFEKGAVHLVDALLLIIVGTRKSGRRNNGALA